MNVDAIVVSPAAPVDLQEVNNNYYGDPTAGTRKSSCIEDVAGNGKQLVRKASLQEIIHLAEDKKMRYEYRRKGRSLSDGSIVKTPWENVPSEAFPSLPNKVLEKLGLHGDGPRARLSEDELERKFTSLALAFSIDSATIKDRCERQRRNRDQTETNLAMEIEKLKDLIGQMQSICIDIEKAELLSTVLTQIDIIVKAASLVSISAERYGSVQHEERLNESVSLMVGHVQMLKQQRDSARRQLQYTKRVLQNSSDTPSQNSGGPQRSVLLANGKKLLTKRRASVATFSQSTNELGKVDMKKFTRRVSDLSLRASSLTKNTRPNRLELIGDLGKIKETETVLHNETAEEEENTFDNEVDFQKLEEVHETPPVKPTAVRVGFSKLTLREEICHRTKETASRLKQRYTTWCMDGTIHEICCFCALICFSISLFTMVSVLLGFEYPTKAWKTSPIFWLWSTTRYREEPCCSVKD